MKRESLIGRLGERCAGPIRWGIDDCAPLCCDHLLERTGTDPMAPWRGAYATREERDAVLHLLVPRVLRRMRELGWRRVEPHEAADPALGLARQDGQWTVCIALGGGWWLTRAERGVLILGSDLVRRAWQWA